MIARAACLFLFLAATPALAQPQPFEPELIPGAGLDTGPAEGPPMGPPQQIFFSPAGEPFRAEMEASYPAAAWFAQADTDRDGALTQAEFSADALAFFDALDVDGDHIVDGFETADYEKEIAPEIRSQLPMREPRTPPTVPPAPSGRMDRLFGPSMATPKGQRRGVPQRQGAAQYGLLNEPHPVRGADSDLDQKISRAEAAAAARTRFRLLDSDGDGVLRLADLPETPAQAVYRDLPKGPRRGPPPGGVEMRLQPAAANAIPLAATAVDSRPERP